MTMLQLGPEDAIFYEHTPPSSDKGHTFVCVNALTGDTGAWKTICAKLEANGHGSLLYNLRGQTASPFASDSRLSSDSIVQDTLKLLEEVKPASPVFVGLSIGGLFAARAILQGAEARGLVLINTLRKDGPRLKWLGDALVRAVEVGGLDLFRDLFLPLLMNEEWLAGNRGGFLKPGQEYAVLPHTAGHYKLLAEAGRDADWDLPYERLTLPALVITGLQDHVFLERDAVDELFNRLPNARRVEMPDAGHLIPMERPEALADELLKYAQEAL